MVSMSSFSCGHDSGVKHEQCFPVRQSRCRLGLVHMISEPRPERVWGGRITLSCRTRGLDFGVTHEMSVR